MSSAAIVRSVQWCTDQHAAPAEFEGSGQAVSCLTLLPGVAQFNETDAAQVLDAAPMTDAPFTDPVNLTRCQLIAFDTVSTTDFTIDVVDAGDITGKPVTPLPSVNVGRIHCDKCGQPVTDDDVPTTADCLVILRSAVGLTECAKCVCDVNASCTITVVDEQVCLQRATGRPTTFPCLPCGACTALNTVVTSTSPSLSSTTLVC